MEINRISSIRGAYWIHTLFFVIWLIVTSLDSVLNIHDIYPGKWVTAPPSFYWQKPIKVCVGVGGVERRGLLNYFPGSWNKKKISLPTDTGIFFVNFTKKSWYPSDSVSVLLVSSDPWIFNVSTSLFLWTISRDTFTISLGRRWEGRLFIFMIWYIFFLLFVKSEKKKKSLWNYPPSKSRGKWVNDPFFYWLLPV